jgi:hypothetical protein
MRARLWDRVVAGVHGVTLKNCHASRGEGRSAPVPVVLERGEQLVHFGLRDPVGIVTLPSL